MRMSNAILNKQDEGKKKKKEMPERHLINESSVRMGRERPTSLVTHEHTHVVCAHSFVYWFCQCGQRDLCLGGDEDRGGEARLDGGGKCLLFFRRK